MKNIILIIGIILSSVFTLKAQSESLNKSGQVLAQNNKGLSIIDQPLTQVSKFDSVKNRDPLKKTFELHQNAAIKIKQLLIQKVKYPSLAIDNCIQGAVLLEVNIGPTGEIEAFNIVKSPHALLDKAISSSMKVLKGLQILPRNHQEELKVWVPFYFRLQ